MPVQTVRTLHLPVTDFSWPFARDNAKEIAANFAQMQAATPQLWNGPILLARKPRVDGDCYSAEYFAASYASYLAWRGWDFPDIEIFNSFGMGALRSRDGAFVLGEMGSHTANPGRIYFPAGTPDPSDVANGMLDMAAGIAREIVEEVGLVPSDYVAAPDWSVIVDGQRIALIRVLQSPLPAAALRDKIMAEIAKQTEPELSAIHLVRGLDDVTDAMPSFMVTYLRHVFG